MKSWLRAFGLMSFVLTFGVAAQAKDWRGIKPLHSTRVDVERILGVKSLSESFDAFKLDDAQVIIFYAREACDSEGEKWNVPRGTVIAFSVTQEPAQRLSMIDVDLSLYKKSSYASDIGVVVTYADEESGFAIEARGDTVINKIYGPTKQDAHLRCSRKEVK